MGCPVITAPFQTKNPIKFDRVFNYCVEEGTPHVMKNLPYLITGNMIFELL